MTQTDRRDPSDALIPEPDPRPLKVALLISLVLHGLLLWLGAPLPRLALAVQEAPTQPVRLIDWTAPPPPPKPLLDKIPRRTERGRVLPVSESLDPDLEPTVKLSPPELSSPLAPVVPPDLIPEPGTPPPPPVPGGDIARPTMLSPCFAAVGYTHLARAARVEGKVILHTFIGRDGVPRQIGVLQSLGHGLDERAVAALERCRFEPARSRITGRAIEVSYTLTVRFSLEGKRR